MKISIEKSSPFKTVTAPASKSMSHRLLICAGLCKGRSTVNNVSFSEDVKATVRCLEAIGCKIKTDGNTVTVDGIRSFDAIGDSVLDCGESASTLRFFIPICLLSGNRVILKGSEKLLSRPLCVYEDIFNKQGIIMDVSSNRIVLDGKIKADCFNTVGNISSQFISGLMFALPLLKNESRINIIPPFVSRPYVDMTAKALESFNVKTELKDKTVIIPGSQEYRPCGISVEGDWSNAAVFYAFKESGADIDIKGTDKDSLQGDKACIDYFKRLKNGFCTVDISDCPDLAPVLIAFAAKHSGGRFTGTDRLRFKESDRIECMKTEIEKFGTVVYVGNNEVTVEARDFHKPVSTVYGHNDHRIVMSMAYLLSFTSGEIEGFEAVKKSFPDFFEVLKNSGVKIHYKP